MEFLRNSGLEIVDENAFVSLKGGMNNFWIYDCGIFEIPFETLKNSEFSCKDGVGPDISFQFNKIAKIPAKNFENLMQVIGCPFGSIFLGTFWNIFRFFYLGSLHFGTFIDLFFFKIKVAYLLYFEF